MSEMSQNLRRGHHKVVGGDGSVSCGKCADPAWPCVFVRSADLRDKSDAALNDMIEVQRSWDYGPPQFNPTRDVVEYLALIGVLVVAAVFMVVVVLFAGGSS